MKEFNLSNEFMKMGENHYLDKATLGYIFPKVREFIDWVLQYPTKSVQELKHAIKLFAGDKLI